VVVDQFLALNKARLAVQGAVLMVLQPPQAVRHLHQAKVLQAAMVLDTLAAAQLAVAAAQPPSVITAHLAIKIGRASCRERVYTSV
jgi:hypothetical protein